MKTYVVKRATVLEGKQVREGDLLHDLSEDAAKPYLKNKAIEESAREEEGETADAAPSALPPLATETKRVAAAETAADKKAAAAEEK